MDVYINDLASFLPNEPVSNDAIEAVLGRIGHIPSATKERMLENNKIIRRYYAIDPETGRFTHTNAILTAEAIRRLAPWPGFKPADIDCLCCGTTSPDLLMPGHALMVAGELGLPPCDAVTTAGICIAGMTALSHAFMKVATGAAQAAVATGSELASSFLRAGFFTPEADPNTDIENHPILAFNLEFLRWMLSDGAGAALVSNRRNQGGISLRIDWIEHLTFAGELETCMLAGGVKQDDGTVTGWRERHSAVQAARENLFAVRQDTALLGREIVRTAIDRTLCHVIEKHRLTPAGIDWFLPHYSSDYFRDKFHSAMRRINFEIPYDRWFTNLPTVGNIGSAAIYLIIEEIFKSGRLEPGQRLLCFIPESGRFSHCFMLLTVCRHS